MPRSGTSLVEQIVSSHTSVTGGGELYSVTNFGSQIAIGDIPPSIDTITKFREDYLSELSLIANDNEIVTDKMPHNFRFIPLICAAFPEAKIIHVKREAEATCWSNYKSLFTR